MKPKHILLLLFTSATFISSNGKALNGDVAITNVSEVADTLITLHGKSESNRIDRGVKHLASLWFGTDGSNEEFMNFCLKQFVPSGEPLDQLFEIIENQLEVIYGHSREISIYLDLPLVTHQRPITEIDRLISNSKPRTDFYKSKLAFAIALNFPYFTPEEK